MHNCTVLPTPTTEIPSRSRSAARRHALWASGAIRIGWQTNIPAGLANRIIAAACQWLQFTRHIGFTWNVRPENAHIRIGFYPGCGNWSYLGTDALRVPGHRPTMNFADLNQDTPQAQLNRSVLHEFGHALGLYHEHQSPFAAIPWDREKCYAYYAHTQGWTRKQTDANLFNVDVDALATPFDPLSIMLYPVPAELLTDPTQAYEMTNCCISATDGEAVRSLYA